MRDDLPEIIALGREKAFPFSSSTPTGCASPTSRATQKLKEAGASCAFLQFDGLRDETYQTLRGRPLLKEKLAAIDACGQAGLPWCSFPRWFWG